MIELSPTITFLPYPRLRTPHLHSYQHLPINFTPHEIEIKKQTSTPLYSGDSVPIIGSVRWGKVKVIRAYVLFSVIDMAQGKETFSSFSKNLDKFNVMVCV